MDAASLLQALKTHFGFNSFRPYQEEIVSQVLARQDCLAILPTGSGKSLCYQLPALLSEGIAVVVSPLIALMQDQVQSLQKLDIPAVSLNSSMTGTERYETFQQLDQQKLLYLSPELLLTDAMQARLRSLKVSFFVIDEVHCISEWGHSFRPEYRQLKCLKAQFPSVPILGVTATATQKVATDILQQLQMRETNVIKGSFDRPNLMIQVKDRNGTRDQVMAFLKDHPGHTGIIYASTRKGVDQMAKYLQTQQIRVAAYHAGLSDQVRAQAFQQFLCDDIQVMVATVAFGMGVHKPDIRFVIHLNMPQNMEQYYQEIGRAGRDGLAATCMMIFNYQDVIIQKHLIEKSGDPLVQAEQRRKTDQLSAFCQSVTCRRKSLLHYFGETYSQEGCKACDNCLDEIEDVDGTIIAQKVLSCVYRMKQKFGVSLVCQVLAGAKTAKIRQFNLDQLSTYGILKEVPRHDIRFYIFALINQGFLYLTYGEYPILRLTQLARGVLSFDTKVRFRKRSVAKVAPKQLVSDGPYDEGLYQKLVALRRDIAQKERVPAYMIFHNKALIEIARHFPRDSVSLLNVNGMGQRKVGRYGDQIIDCVTAYSPV